MVKSRSRLFLRSQPLHQSQPSIDLVGCPATEGRVPACRSIGNRHSGRALQDDADQQGVVAVVVKRRAVVVSDFSHNFSEYEDEVVQAAIITVTSQGRVVGAYLSAIELERFEHLKRREREVLKIGELDEETLEAIEVAEYGSEPQ